MKKKVFIAIIVASSLVMQHVNAQTGVRASVTTITKASPQQNFTVSVLQDTDKEKFILVVHNPANENLRIAVDGTNSTGYLQHFNDNLFQKKFSMSAAEDGEYLITVTGNKRTIRKRLSLSTTTEIVRSVAVKE